MRPCFEIADVAEGPGARIGRELPEGTIRLNQRDRVACFQYSFKLRNMFKTRVFF